MRISFPTLLAPLVAALLALPQMAVAERYRDRSVPMAVVTTLDVDRYLGKWYEIARYPNRFERNCAGVTAEYGWMDGGEQVSVLNTCRDETPTGPARVATAEATLDAPGRFKVSFVKWLPFAKGDYWVLHVDPDYSLAVVGEPSGKFGWVLARDKTISEAKWARAMSVLEQNGYDTSALIRTLQ